MYLVILVSNFTVNPSTLVKRIYSKARWYRFCPTGCLVDVDGGHVVVVDSMELEGLCEGGGGDGGAIAANIIFSIDVE